MFYVSRWQLSRQVCLTPASFLRALLCLPRRRLHFDCTFILYFLSLLLQLRRVYGVCTRREGGRRRPRNRPRPKMPPQGTVNFSQSYGASAKIRRRTPISARVSRVRNSAQRGCRQSSGGERSHFGARRVGRVWRRFGRGDGRARVLLRPVDVPTYRQRRFRWDRSRYALFL